MCRALRVNKKYMFFWKPKGKRQFGRHMDRYIKEIKCEKVDWKQLDQDSLFFPYGLFNDAFNISA
jgi:hypothetical protein